MRQPGLVVDEEDRPRSIVISRHRMPCGGLCLDLLSDLVEAVLGIGEEDQSKDRPPILVGGEG